MIRRPPRSTLFPTRRSSDLNHCSPGTAARLRFPNPAGMLLHWRSEEHTSELQSQSNLVCRLLLEKKKKEIDDSASPGRRSNAISMIQTALFLTNSSLQKHLS